MVTADSTEYRWPKRANNIDVTEQEKRGSVLTWMSNFCLSRCLISRPLMSRRQLSYTFCFFFYNKYNKSSSTPNRQLYASVTRTTDRQPSDDDYRCILPCCDLDLWPLTLKTFFSNFRSRDEYLWLIDWARFNVPPNTL